MAILRAKQYPYYTVYKWLLSYTDFNAQAIANPIKFLGYIPQRHNVAWVKIVPTTRFNGGAITNSVLAVRPGISGVIMSPTTSNLAITNVFQVPVDFQGAFKYTDQVSGVISGSTKDFAASQTTANEIWAIITLTGGIGTALARGQATIWVGTIPTF